MSVPAGEQPRAVLAMTAEKMESVQEIGPSHTERRIDPLFSNGAMTGPSFLGVQITSRCNLSCPNCLQGNPKKATHDLTPDELRGLLDLDLFSSLRKTAVVGGEVFLSPFFFPIVSLLTDRGLSVESIATNGLLLHRNISTLAKTTIRYINVSLDGVSDKEYRTRRGGQKGHFDLIKSNVEDLASACANEKTIAVSILTHMGNITRMPFYIEKLWDWPIDRLTFISMVRWPGALPNTLERLLLFERPELSALSERVMREYSPPFVVDLPDCISAPGQRTCRLPFMNLTINASGDVSPCGWTQPDPSFGNLFTDGSSVWNNETMTRWRQGILYGGSTWRIECRICPYRGPQGFSYNLAAGKWFQRENPCA